MDIKEEGMFPTLSNWPSWPNHTSPFDLDRLADSWTNVNFDIDPIRYMDFNYNEYSDIFKVRYLIDSSSWVLRTIFWKLKIKKVKTE